jgi:hypothetical protein
MITYFADIKLRIEVDDGADCGARDLKNEIYKHLSGFVEKQASIEGDGTKVIIDVLKVEESKHGFRVQDTDGNWTEPSDAFAEMVKRDIAKINAFQKKRER